MRAKGLKVELSEEKTKTESLNGIATKQARENMKLELTNMELQNKNESIQKAFVTSVNDFERMKHATLEREPQEQQKVDADSMSRYRRRMGEQITDE